MQGGEAEKQYEIFHKENSIGKSIKSPQKTHHEKNPRKTTLYKNIVFTITKCF